VGWGGTAENSAIFFNLFFCDEVRLCGMCDRSYESDFFCSSLTKSGPACFSIALKTGICKLLFVLFGLFLRL